MSCHRPKHNWHIAVTSRGVIVLNNSTIFIEMRFDHALPTKETYRSFINVRLDNLQSWCVLEHADCHACAAKIKIFFFKSKASPGIQYFSEPLFGLCVTKLGVFLIPAHILNPRHIWPLDKGMMLCEGIEIITSPFTTMKEKTVFSGTRTINEFSSQTCEAATIAS